MKPLIRIALMLALCFASTFILVKATGLITIDKIESWLLLAKATAPLYVAGIVVFFLFIDLFIAVPTLTITLLAGHFLGYTQGALTALLGMFLAAATGYGISYRFGPRILTRVLKDPEKKEELNTTFRDHGFIMILLARAAPILPEVTACLAGITRMRFVTFLTAWAISTVPYVLIAAYAGSISSVENPKPAIFTAIGLTTLLWGLWFVFRKIKRRQPA